MSDTSNIDVQYERILEKYKELKEEANSSCRINREDLFDVFNTHLLMEWIKKKTEWQRVYRIYDEKRKTHYRQLYEYYRTEFHLKLTSKDEYQLYIESDSNYTMIGNICNMVKEILEFISSILDLLKSRQFEIKHIIEYRKFVNGQ